MKINYNNRRFIESLYSTNQYLQVKSLNDIPKEIIKEIRLVSLPGSKEGVTPGQPFGSYINRVADYFGDIDVIQLFSGCCSIEEVGIKTAKAIQEMVNEINKRPEHFFSEFKAGIDHAYYFNYGTLVEGVYTPAPNLLSDSEKLYSHKLLDNKEIKIIREIATRASNGSSGTSNDYDIIFNLFREHFLLRWSEKEVMQGFKMISTGKKLLSEAVLDQTAVKIDMIIINPGGKFIEVTNFMGIGLSNKKNQFLPINIDIKDITPEDLPVEIEKLYFSDFHYSPFKVVKRSFAYLKYLSLNWNKPIFDKSKYVLRNITKEYIDDILDRYVQVLQSTVNILYTVNSELDAIRLVLERGFSNSSDNKKSYQEISKKISSRLDMLKEPLANVLEIDSESLQLLMVMMDKCREEQSREKKIECIEILRKTFKEIINFWTVAYFDQLGLNPPPNMILPEVMSYGQVIREPFSNPVNPLKHALETGDIRGGSIVSSIFRKVANAYRSRNKEKLPDGRPRVRMLRDGEYHWLNGNYIGPGTHIWDPEVRNYPPYNDVDNCARNHDIAYEKAVQLPDGQRQRAIIEADKEIVECVAKYPDQEGSTAARLGINSKMKLGEVLPMVSNAIFKQISSGRTKPKPKLIDPRAKPTLRRNPKLGRGSCCQECEHNMPCGGRTVKSASDVKNSRLLAPGSAPNRLRPGEDPEVAKMALKDAFGLVKAAYKGEPEGVIDAVKQIGTHFVDIATKKELTPYERYKQLHGLGKNKLFSEHYSDDGKKVWVLA